MSCLCDAQFARIDHHSPLRQFAHSSGHATGQSAAVCGWKTCVQHSTSLQTLKRLISSSQTCSCTGDKLHSCASVLPCVAHVYCMHGSTTVNVIRPALMQVQAAELAVQIDQAMVRLHV
jgi:hypothetical protein